MLMFRKHPFAPGETEVTAGDHGLLLYGCDTALRARGAHWLGLAPPAHVIWLPPSHERVSVCAGSAFRSAVLQAPGWPGLRAEPAVLNARPLLGALLERVEQARVQSGHPQQPHFISVMLHEVCHERALPSSVVLPRDARLLEVCRRIECQLGAGIDAESIATASSLSSRSLHRLFVAECGVPTACWIRRRRLIEALALMSAGVSLSDIAGRVGYSSFSAFCAMFRQAFGEPPRRFQSRLARA